MSDQQKLQKLFISVDVARLILLLRSRYPYGTGGISKKIPIDESQVSRMSKSCKGNCNYSNTARLLNLAIDEVEAGLITEQQVRDCLENEQY